MDTNLAHDGSARVDLQLIPSVAQHSDPGRKTDRLFAALDGSRVRRSGEEFKVEVYSITNQTAGRWIQLGLRGAETEFVTLRLPRQAGLQQASAALLTWIADPAHLSGAVEAA
jgi:hypothetical protein